MKTLKKILVLAPEIPFPVFKGNQSRIDQTLKVLIEAGHEVSIAVLNSNQEKRASVDIQNDLKSAYPQLKEIGIRRHPKFSPSKPNLLSKINIFQKNNLISDAESCPDNFKKLVGEMIRKNKPTHILTNYVKLDRAIPSSYRGTKIVDTHDIQTNILRAAINAGTNKRKVDVDTFEMHEFELLKKYEYIISINSNETKQIRQKLPNNKVFTIPAFNDFQIRQNHGNKKYDILFVGSASPFNAEGIKLFIQKSFPAIKKAYPKVTLAIAGDVSNVGSVRSLNGPNIVYLGRVPNLSSTYADSSIVVSPIISGAGMKVKNIEALSHGMPIVATSFSMDGIDVTDRKNALIQDDWSAFARAVIELLKNQQLRSTIAEGAYNLARSNYSKDTASRNYDAIIDNNFNFTNDVVESFTPQTNRNLKRTKALIYSTDAEYLIGYNISIAEELRKLGVYSEFIKMECTRENRFLANGFLVHTVRQDISKTRRQEIRKELSGQHNEDSLGKVVIQGIDISEDIDVYREMFPVHFAGKKSIDVVTQALLILESILSKVDKFTPDFLIGWNGNGPHFIFLMKVAAKIKNLPIFHIERGLLPDTLVFDPQGVNYKSTIAGSYLPLINSDERIIAAQYINDFASHGKTIVATQASNISSRKEILQEITLSEDDCYVFFPLQIEGDSNIVLNSPIYKKMQHVIEDLIEVTRDLNVHLVCRPHPENNISIEELRSSYPSVIFDNKLHLHSALKNSIANVVINSTVGLESIILGTPTIALGHSTYSGKGITYDAFHKDQIKDHLSAILKGSHDYVRCKQKTECLVHLLFSSTLFKLAESKSNGAMLKSTLLKNGVIINADMPPPLPPKYARNYMSKNTEFLRNLRSAGKIKVINSLADNTTQWLNGSNKPFVTNDLIVKKLSELTDAKIEINNDASIKQLQTDKNDGLVIYIKNSTDLSEPGRGSSTDSYTLDEYFYLA
ncbi:MULTISPECIES: glycosyltransferase [Pseudomonas]|uniref:Glycosyltransferase n=1 Tax=Pseudomonas kielensis TaxID=2762577 RepID=A0A7X1GDL1_9PSED|nr:MULTISPECIES: glycosyltransferase [Pseudomonas]MBC2689518.1 glycosyltransferase [Pseudomonas kielensis]NBB33738.1 glycosyltransferase [Pseudomonas sp. BC115LW]